MLNTRFGLHNLWEKVEKSYTGISKQQLVRAMWNCCSNFLVDFHVIRCIILWLIISAQLKWAYDNVLFNAFTLTALYEISLPPILLLHFSIISARMQMCMKIVVTCYFRIDICIGIAVLYLVTLNTVLYLWSDLLFRLFQLSLCFVFHTQFSYDNILRVCTGVVSSE